MKTYSFTLVLLFLASAVSSQNVIDNNNAQDFLKALTGGQSNTLTQFDNRYVEIKGSPFVSKDWTEGSIIVNKNNQVVKGIFIMYNAYDNELWVKVDEKKTILLDNSTIKGFVINDNDIKRVFVKDDIKKYKATFFEVICDGKVSVLKKPHVNLFKSDTKSGYQMEKSNFFKASPKYFIKKGKGEFQLLKRKSYALSKKFPKLKRKMKKYIKKEKIKLNKDEDLKKLMKWINESLEKKPK